MSELIQKNDNSATIRWKLLTGASVLALTAYISPAAHAEDSAQPQVWIELGGQLSQLEGGQETFTSPPLMNVRPSIFSPSEPFERPPLYSIDEFATLSLQPENSDWIFSASIRYGRSASNRHVHQQTYPKSFATSVYFSSSNHVYHFKPGAAKFADTKARTSQTHDILDFQAGKDVGLGLFGGKEASSVLSVGVRFAQFSSKSNIALKSNPDWHFQYKYLSYPSVLTHTVKWTNGQPYHSNAASLLATRNFRGVGPSISWNGSAPFAGNSQAGELSFDWGVNAALLFGHQRTKVHHQTTGQHGNALYSNHGHRSITYQAPATPDHTRSRNVTVPNVGGSVGLIYRMEDFKVSFGYRADMFFGAIDAGIDARRNENRGFYGPFASISVGLGD